MLWTFFLFGFFFLSILYYYYSFGGRALFMPWSSFYSILFLFSFFFLFYYCYYQIMRLRLHWLIHKLNYSHPNHTKNVQFDSDLFFTFFFFFLFYIRAIQIWRSSLNDKIKTNSRIVDLSNHKIHEQCNVIIVIYINILFQFQFKNPKHTQSQINLFSRCWPNDELMLRDSMMIKCCSLYFFFFFFEVFFSPANP